MNSRLFSDAQRENSRQKDRSKDNELPMSMLTFLKTKPDATVKQKNGFLILQQRRATERRQKAKATLITRRAQLAKL